jgi:anaerobic selenocysteine-containing dehydrogenase
MKITHLDPRLRSAGPFADSWLPIQPGTHLAMALAVCHELVTQGFLDVPYLSTYTNAPFLVKPDGAFAKVTVGDGDEAADVSLVWDVATGRAIPHGEAQEPALGGSFEVEGEAVAPAFQLFRDHVAQYSPEWAAGITGLDARQIRAVATEFGSNAQIGATTVVDGVVVPYRPVGIMAYHMAQQELGFQALRARGRHYLRHEGVRVRLIPSGPGFPNMSESLIRSSCRSCVRSHREDPPQA